MTNNNLPTAQVAAAAAVIDKEVEAVLDKSIFSGFSDAEKAYCKGLVRATRLNPIKRELWFIKGKDGRIQAMTGIAGFYAIANSHPQFDGIEVEVQPKQGKPELAIAKVYRKDRSHPMTAEAYFAEYNKGFGNWNTMPRVMLSKCAESMALRKAFPQELNDFYTREEMPREYDVEPQPEAPKTNGTPRTMPANERIEADSMPDQYKLEAPRSTYGKKLFTLAEIHEKDRKWIPATLASANRRQGCTQRDLVNLGAFWAVMKDATEAQRACEEEFDSAAAAAEANAILEARNE